MRRLEEARLTRDRPYSGTPRITTHYQDREIRLTPIQNKFENVLQTAWTIHGRHYPMISPGTVLRHLRENYIRLTKSLRWSRK